MENLGARISDYRKSAKLTQKELGDMLNVSAQAVSKWENGQAEPDMSTAIKMCEIFKISTNELLGVEPPAQETAATAAVTAVPPPAPVTVEQKLIYGKCATCGKSLGIDEAIIIKGYDGAQKLYCKECNTKRITEEQRAHDAFVAEERRAHAVSERAKHKKKTVISVIVGGVVGVAVFAALALVLTLAGDVPAWFALPFAAVFGVAGLSFAMQMFWDGTVTDMFFFCFKSFKMPGVIFTLDLDGLLFLIFVKVFGAILSVFLSAIFFIVGFVIVYLGSILILPFACIKRAMEAKKLKAALA